MDRDTSKMRRNLLDAYASWDLSLADLAESFSLGVISEATFGRMKHRARK